MLTDAQGDVGTDWYQFQTQPSPGGVVRPSKISKSIGGSLFELYSGIQKVDKQTDALTGNNSKSNLSKFMSCHPVKFQIDWWKRL